MTAVSQEELKDLIRSPKPAFFARGVTTDPERGLTFTAVHDGREDWFIERPKRIELKSGSRTVLVEEAGVKIIDIPVASNNDVKVNLDGRRIAYLAEGSLEVTGSTIVAGRACFEVRAWGLKRGDDRPFEMAVDQETGIILRVSKGERLFEVTEFRIGVQVSS